MGEVNPSRHLDNALRALDVGLQRRSASERRGPVNCWRCGQRPVADGSTAELCVPCRSYLRDEDPPAEPVVPYSLDEPTEPAVSPAPSLMCRSFGLARSVVSAIHDGLSSWRWRS